MADGIDPDLGELPGLLAEKVAIDQIVDRRGDEECRAQQQPGQGRGTSHQFRPAGRDPPQGQAGKDHGRQRQQPEHRGEHRQRRKQSGQQPRHGQGTERAVARDLFVSRVEHGAEERSGVDIGLHAVHFLVGFCGLLHESAD